ncbi:MAG: hypothetical protein WCT10_01670 [Patescibacteria group bacterium]|jgi:hypothetical protein
MRWLIIMSGLLAPRGVFIYLILNDWFEGLLRDWWIPLLGFIFAPYTLVWYVAVLHWYHGVWGRDQIIGLVLAILLDLFFWKQAAADN